MLGLAGVGVIVLAATISDYTNRVDSIVTETLYPAICAVRDRSELLAESFVKSNRLALMWGMPFGIGLAMFAPDLVEFVLGSRWRPGVTLIRPLVQSPPSATSASIGTPSIGLAARPVHWASPQA